MQQYFANVPYEDLEGRCEETMARIALEHLEFGAVRREDEALLRIYNANEKDHGYTSQYTFVEMVNDDMAFLVDSVAAAINRHNLGVHITVHPIIHLRCNRNGKLVEIPFGYTRLVVRPSGSTNIWCEDLSAKRTTLSSTDGQ